MIRTGSASLADSLLPSDEASQANDNGIKSKVYSSQKKLTLFQFSILLFTLTCGGPFGIEDAIQAAGVQYTLIALAIVPLVYSLPQSLMCAELGSMMPSHHGYVIWVYRAFEDTRFGSFVGFYNAIGELFSLLSILILMNSSGDIPIYTVLMSFYVQKLIKSDADGTVFTWWQDYFFKLFMILLGAVFNILNINSLGSSTAVFTVLILLPFLIGFGYNLPHTNFENWTYNVPTNEQEEYQWGLFVSTLLWLHTGWDSVGCLTAELEFAKSKIFWSFFVAIILDYLAYTVPVLGALATNVNCTYDADTNTDCWDDGYLYTAYNNIHALRPWLGILVVISGFLSNFGVYISEMAVHVRTFWAVTKPYVLLLPNGEMYVQGTVEENCYFDDDLNVIDVEFVNAKIRKFTQEINNGTCNGRIRQIRIGMMPRWLCGTKWDRTGAPARGVILQSVISAILVLFDFQTLLQGTILVNGMTWTFEFIAFLRLRYTEPEAYRPYKIPGGNFTAWLITIDKLCVVAVLMTLIVVEEPGYLLVFVLSLVVVVLWYGCYLWYWRKHGETQRYQFEHLTETAKNVVVNEQSMQNLDYKQQTENGGATATPQT